MSHNNTILHVLQNNTNQWVALPVISEFTKRHCLSQCFVVHSRIADLRAKGHAIENKTEIHNGIKHSYYRLNA